MYKMAQIFAIIIFVVGIQGALCLRHYPRRITVKFLEFDESNIVKKDDHLNKKVTNLQRGVTTDAKITAFEAKVKTLYEEEGKMLKQNTATIFEQNKIRTRWCEVENEKDIIENMLEAGCIVLSRNHSIILPKGELREEIKERHKKSAHILFTYEFANRVEGFEFIGNPFGDLHVNKIMSIDEDGKITNKSLEFTIPAPFGMAIFTLGSVTKGKFLIEGKNIQHYDLNAGKAKPIGEMKISDLFASYNGAQLKPTFVEGLNMDENTPGMKNFNGKITGFSLAVNAVYTMNDGKVSQEYFERNEEEVKGITETLDKFIFHLVINPEASQHWDVVHFEHDYELQFSYNEEN